jgi:hypothetical protein
MPDHVRTVYGNNSDLIAAVARLYLPDGAVVADVTWGFGVFWKRFNGRRRRFTLIGSDLLDRPGLTLRADFRRLPYADDSIDVTVLDPPYTHCGHYINSHRYGSHLTDGMRHPEIVALYREGMVEALRVLRPGGTLWVKCKDENDGKQHRTHIELFNIAIVELGLHDQDFFVLAPRTAVTRRHLQQKTAHKSHSYLWVFRKPAGSSGSDAERYAIAALHAAMINAAARFKRHEEFSAWLGNNNRDHIEAYDPLRCTMPLRKKGPSIQSYPLTRVRHTSVWSTARSRLIVSEPLCRACSAASQRWPCVSARWSGSPSVMHLRPNVARRWKPRARISTPLWRKCWTTSDSAPSSPTLARHCFRAVPISAAWKACRTRFLLRGCFQILGCLTAAARQCGPIRER